MLLFSGRRIFLGKMPVCFFWKVPGPRVSQLVAQQQRSGADRTCRSDKATQPPPQNGWRGMNQCSEPESWSICQDPRNRFARVDPRSPRNSRWVCEYAWLCLWICLGLLPVLPPYCNPLSSAPILRMPFCPCGAPPLFLWYDGGRTRALSEMWCGVSPCARGCRPPEVCCHSCPGVGH